MGQQEGKILPLLKLALNIRDYALVYVYQFVVNTNSTYHC